MKISDVTAALADQVSDGIIVTDASGVIYVNPSNVTLLGAGSSQDVLGKPLSVVFVPNEDAVDMLQPIPSRARGLHDREIAVAGKLLWVDGEMVEVCGTSFPVRWEGTGRCRVLIVRHASLSDIHSRTSDQTDGYWEPVEVGARVGSWERDLASGTETWSDDQYRILGFEPGTVSPGPDAFTQVLHPDDRDRVVRALDRLLPQTLRTTWTAASFNRAAHTT